ncbi:MAG: hypothetical protein NTZ56_21660 [Acidobacteria bacterium]|nr:hypothetical protein [Acidobacteriota bacterium]
MLKKISLATAILSLTAVGAFAQCSAVATQNVLRPEGLTELVGDITISCGANALSNVALTVTIPSAIPVTNVTGTAAGAGVASAAGTATVYGTVSGNSIVFTNLSVNANATIVVSGIRVNASASTPGVTVTAQSVIISNNVVNLNASTNVGLVNTASFAFAVVGGTDATVTSKSASTLSICLSYPSSSTANAVTGLLRFTELYGAAFRTVADDTTTGSNGSIAGNATQLRLAFSNIPAGASIYVPMSITAGTTASDATGVTIATTSSSATALTSSIAATIGTPTYTAAGTDSNVIASWGKVTSSDNSVIYTVSAASSAYASTVNIPYIVTLAASPSNGVGTATVLGSLGPVSSSVYSRLATTGSAVTAFSTATCSTNILFPFVTNDAGFDTGLAIANTTADPFSTANQSGTCALNYYGTYSDGGALPTAATTSSIAAGKYAALTLSGGGSGVAALRPGFTGYIIAQCTFQLAHGYAFISDLGAKNLAHGYLALVLPSSAAGRGASGGTPEATSLN